MVIALKDFFEKEMQEGIVLLDKPVLRVAEVAEATGINKRTVYRILKEPGRRDLLRVLQREVVEGTIVDQLKNTQTIFKRA